MDQFSTIYDEGLLFQQIAEGDEAAFRKLFAIYIPFLQPTLYRIVKNNEAVEDVIQETFLRIWLYRDKLPDISKPRSWVLKVAYFRAFNYLRLQKNHLKVIDVITQNSRNTHADTEEALAFTTLSNLVHRAVSKLPIQQKKVYRLSREHGLTIAEIAEKMELAPQSVKNTLGRAIKFIREFIEKHGYAISMISLLFLFP